MRALLGLTVTAAVLAGCTKSSDNGTINTPGAPVTPVEMTDTPVTPSEVTDTPVTPVTVSDSPDTPDTPMSPPILPVPSASDTAIAQQAVADSAFILGNVLSTLFDSDAGTLAVQIAFDGSDELQQYVADGTINGYSRFTLQDDPLDREFKAFARESDDGLLQAAVVMDGGQFNTFLGGGAITQNSYTAVTTGLASYAGDYVGLSNLGPALVTGNGADSSLVPGSATEITGSVFINVDFAGSQVNGSIYDRVFDPDGTGFDLQSIILTASAIEENGKFVGTVEFEDLSAAGNYNGALGGDEAANIAGVVSLGAGFLEGATVDGIATTLFDDVIGETEYGVFVNGQCQAGGAGCFDAK